MTEDRPPHHPWQHGLYVGLNDVNGVGFWTEGLLAGHEKDDGTFHPAPLASAIVDTSSARWRVDTTCRAPGGQDLLVETQEWRLRDFEYFYLLDLHWSLRSTTDVRFGQYAYGGPFIRMPYRDACTGAVLTSEGAATPESADQRRARWVAISMLLAGRNDSAGLAIFDHPANPEHPVPWRVDGQLGVAPSRCIPGPWALPTGNSIIFFHRFFIFTGPIDSSAIELHWIDFSRETPTP